jgi:excisionase family DNA binding protein
MPHKIKPPASVSLPASRKGATKLDVAREHGVGLRTVDKWISQRVIPYKKLGRSVRFDLDAVERALSRFTVREVQ